MLCIIQYAKDWESGRKNMEGIVFYYCTVMPTPVFIFSGWEKLRILTKHIS
jgi:hypothetical protein